MLALPHTLPRPLAAAWLLALAMTAPAQAALPPEVSAIQVSIGGIGPGVDQTAFKKVKLLIGDAVYRGTIDYFDVSGYGKEGGFSACMEKGTFAATGGFEALIKALKAVRVDTRTSFYSVDTAERCVYPVAPSVSTAL
jgi:hypothetical protein